MEVDVCSSQTTVNKVLSELFYPFRAQQNLGQQHKFSDRQASQYGSKLDWSRGDFCQLLYENPGPKPVLFVSKATKGFMECLLSLNVPKLSSTKLSLERI